ncbi:hypothetical protein Clacol_000665 [Clathrus columnatus]|uniref:RRM domain-containing protein n=1 Tax=Clathrus columnatus TaxID=1419009 RepID=A0AAV4ZZW3_9AGAM|nr:hypothetical protein Clacol_000665 [Clathrus columnatus]
METIQKRLHISGLTPAITESDIRSRLQNFVNVTVIDGFGKLNAIGEPRKYAYATVNATEPNLARCLNHLSGTVWKGAKLRIGEAKPDYTQRLAVHRLVKERQQESQLLEEGNLRKRRRLLKGVQGIHAKDMSLVTLGNVDSRPGWQKTTLSHLIRPMKMRPSRPLPVPSDIHSKGSVKSGKRKVLPCPSRATIQKIDPKCWGAVHMTENMLQSVIIAPSAPSTQRVEPKSKISTTTPFDSSYPTLKTPLNNPVALVTSTETQQTPKATTKFASESLVDVDIRRENSGHLALLSRMFGELSDEWGGREHVSSSSETEDENDGDAGAEDVGSPEFPEEIQDVSLSKAISNSREKDSGTDVIMEDAPEIKSLETNEKNRRISSQTPEVPSQAQKSKYKSLKDLFKPQEDGFSLMAGLDLDLELDLDPAFDFSKPTETQVSGFIQAQSAPEPSTPFYHHDGFTLDPRYPLFFPQPDNPRRKDLLTIAETQGWKFHRTDDSELTGAPPATRRETIRKQWDDAKGDLTREWKKRSREAVKARRRRFGAGAIEE